MTFKLRLWLLVLSVTTDMLYNTVWEGRSRMREGGLGEEIIIYHRS